MQKAVKDESCDLVTWFREDVEIGHALWSDSRGLLIINVGTADVNVILHDAQYNILFNMADGKVIFSAKQFDPIDELVKNYEDEDNAAQLR